MIMMMMMMIMMTAAIGKVPETTAIQLMVMTKTYLDNAAAPLGVVRLTHLRGDEGLRD